MNGSCNQTHQINRTLVGTVRRTVVRRVPPSPERRQLLLFRDIQFRNPLRQQMRQWMHRLRAANQTVANRAASLIELGQIGFVLNLSWIEHFPFLIVRSRRTPNLQTPGGARGGLMRQPSRQVVPLRQAR